MSILTKFSDSGDNFHLAVANGFPPRVYSKFAANFVDNYRVISIPPTALQESCVVPDELKPWNLTIGKELAENFVQNELYDVIAVGHSFGAIATIIAAIAHPDRFKALILLDPTILPEHVTDALKALRATDSLDDFPLATRASKRQQYFDNRQLAFDHFREKSLFSDWSDDALWLYINHGFQVDGECIRLVWPPEWEAYYYKTIYTDIWDVLPHLSDKLPVLLIRGGNSDTFYESEVQRFLEILPHTRYIEIAGAGHLFPLSHPDKTARMIQEFLNENISRR